MHRPLIRLGCLILCLAIFPTTARAQTVAGDILRGKGRYLEGAGWYNFNTARAGRLNVETWKAYNREVQRLYRDYMIDRYNHIQGKKGTTNALQAEAQRRFEEDQRRWRDNPTPADISSGNALNAIVADLADPSIDPSNWRTANVELPTNLTLTALAFKIADPKKSRIQQSTVAIDRLLIKDGWPLPFRRPEIQRECTAYEKSIKTVVEKCRTGVELQATDYDKLRDSVGVLQKTLETAIPTRDNQRTQAREYVKRLDDASKIFAEQEYAEELIRDVTEHKATSIAELLAFMRDYRLMFADSGSSPEAASLHEGLYGLLRRQKESLGIRDAAAPREVFTAGSIWVGGGPQTLRLRVTNRDGGRFRAIVHVGENAREIEGEINGDKIYWSSGNSRPVNPPPKAQRKGQGRPQAKAATKGAMHAESFGTIRGEELHINFNANGRQGQFTLRKTR